MQNNTKLFPNSKSSRHLATHIQTRILNNKPKANRPDNPADKLRVKSARQIEISRSAGRVRLANNSATQSSNFVKVVNGVAKAGHVVSSFRRIQNHKVGTSTEQGSTFTHGKSKAEKNLRVNQENGLTVSGFKGIQLDSPSQSHKKENGSNVKIIRRVITQKNDYQISQNNIPQTEQNSNLIQNQSSQNIMDTLAAPIKTKFTRYILENGKKRRIIRSVEKSADLKNPKTIQNKNKVRMLKFQKILFLKIIYSTRKVL